MLPSVHNYTKNDFQKTAYEAGDYKGKISVEGDYFKMLPEPYRPVLLHGKRG